MIFEKYRADLARELRRVIPEDSPLFGMLGYHMGWLDEHGNAVTGEYSGKLLRPGLCLLCCEAAGGDWTAALPAAASLEIIHNFSLIHDDIEDGSLERRRRRTLWAIWGEARAINSGDAMHTLAEIAMLGLRRRGVAPEIVLEALEISNETCLRLCEGQELDLLYEKRLDITTGDYFKMIDGKTGALFQASFKIGVLLANGRRDIVEKAGVCGRKLGLAFQIKDDILGIWGGKEVGKPVDSDLMKKKKTLPVVFALERATAGDRALLLDFYAKSEICLEDAALVRKVLERVGAREYAGNLAQQYYSGALTELEALALQGVALQGLREAARLIVERQF